MRRDDLDALEAVLPTGCSLAPFIDHGTLVLDATDDVPLAALGVTRSWLEGRGLRAGRGRNLCDADIRTRAGVCVLGAEAARALGTRGRVGGDLRIGGDVFTSSKWWPCSRTPLATAWRKLESALERFARGALTAA